MLRTRAFPLTLAALAMLALAASAGRDAAHASPLGLRFHAGAGPLFAPGPNSIDLGSGYGVQIEAARSAGPRLEWFGAIAYQDFSGIRLEPAAYPLFGGNLYLPEDLGDEAFRGYGLELGLRRRASLGAVDLSVEGSAGIARAEEPRVRGPYTNDRRPDPLAATPSDVSGTGGSFSIGAGGALPLRQRVGLFGAVSARWLSALGISGPIVPIRLGLAWPMEPRNRGAAGDATLGAPSGSRLPRLRIGAGTAWLDTPADVWRESHPAAGFSAGVEIPLAHGLAMRLDGTHALYLSARKHVVRQESDAFGNIVNIYAGESPRWTATFMTAGLSASVTRGRVTPYVHLGAGLGRTGGDGSTIRTVAYVSPSGPDLTPLYLTDHQGFGRPHTGAAWAGGAGLEWAVAPSWGVFVEGTLLGVNLDAPDVQLLAARTGVVLR